MNLKKIEEFLKREKEPRFRLKQIKEAVFLNLIEDWNQATNLSENLRKNLLTHSPISSIKNTKLLFSDHKRTIKAVFELNDNFCIESVLMKYEDRPACNAMPARSRYSVSGGRSIAGRITICVSSQAGCPIKCKFCATGQNGFERNLTSEEIVDQVLFFARLIKTFGQKITSIVYMGMGEPFLNYENVLESIKILNSEIGIGARKISISTAGIVEGIEKLAKEPMQLNLAISLHAPTNELRSKLMPINEKYNLEKVIKAVDNYINTTNRKVMFEYLMIDGVNDTQKHASQLTILLKDLRRSNFVVNLVSLNTIKEFNFKPSKIENIQKFKEILEKTRMSVTERYRFGQEINAACGQLAGK